MSSPKTRESSDYREMLIRKMNDLKNWGYIEYALKYAMRALIKYGWKGEISKEAVALIEGSKKSSSNVLSRKQRATLELFKISPLLFDALCIVTGKRVRLRGREL